VARILVALDDVKVLSRTRDPVRGRISIARTSLRSTRSCEERTTVPFAAVVTIIGALLTVIVLAAYLIRVALILRRVSGKLGAVIVGVGSAGEKTAPVGSIVGEINKDLAGVDNALKGVLAKERSPKERSPSPSSSSMKYL
jgi:hypothetical protein